MNLLFIYPEFPTTFWSFKHALKFERKRSAYPPLGLMTIAPLFPAPWNRRLVDLNVEPLRDRDLKWADVALISGMLVQRKSLEEVARRCRRHGLTVVVGGPLTSGTDFSDIADAVVEGEAEELIAALAADLEAKTLKPLYKALERPSLHGTPQPDWSLIRRNKYSAMAIQYSRGCPFQCEFCDIIEIYGRKPRTKTPEQVLNELDSLMACGWRGSVFIVDDNFIGNKRNVKNMLPVLADWNERNRYPFYFCTEASLNLAEDEELLGQMRRANFTRVFLGIETPVEASLLETQKYQNTRKDLLESVHLIQSYGMEVMAGFIVGFDNDPPNVFEEQVRFIRESAIPVAMVGLLTALPNTQLYRRLQREGRLLMQSSGNNVVNDFTLNFVPRMNTEALVEGYKEILKVIYNPEEYYRRVLRFLQNRGPSAGRTMRKVSDYLAFCRSLLRQGVLSRSRMAYWRFMVNAVRHHRDSFDTAVTLAIMGYHLQKLTEAYCES